MKHCLFFFLMSCGLQINAQRASLPVPKHKFIVISHRGDHTQAPENTIVAFENGIKAGVDYVEIDLRTTKDSMLVIMHDATVDRMTDGKGKVSDLTYAVIRQLKITDKKNPEKIYKVPSFEEVLKVCKDNVYIYLDYKNANVQQAYNMIKRFGMEKQIIVYINEPDQFVDWRRIAPSMPLMLSMPDNIKTVEDLHAFFAKYPLELLDGDYSDYTSTLLNAATEAGITTWPDIQSAKEANNWDKALEIGFKGLQTDHPEALIAYLEKKGLR